LYYIGVLQLQRLLSGKEEPMRNRRKFTVGSEAATSEAIGSDDLQKDEKLGRTDISRRDFMLGAATIGAISVGGLALAGCAPAANGAGGDVAGAGAPDEPDGYPWELSQETFMATGSDPIAPEAPPVSWDQEADFVVVGLGGGGLMATLEAALAGYSVIALEKSAHSGGSTQESTEFAVGGGTKVHEAAGIDYNPAALSQALLSGVSNSGDADLVYTLAVEGPEFINYLIDLGATFGLSPFFAGGTSLVWEGACDGGLAPRATKYATDFAYEQIQKTDATVLFNTPVATLIKDGERVVGVKAIGTGDTPLYINAKKAVILTSGGMANNSTMLAKYCPTIANQVRASMVGTADTGEGIRMGLGAGAEIAGRDSYYAFDGAMDWGVWTHYLYAGDVQLARQPWLGINQDGKRYTYFDDSRPGLGVRALIAQAQVLQAQPGSWGHIFFDADYETNAPLFEQVFCRKLITPDMYDVERLPEDLGPHDWRKGALNAIESGAIKQADTIEELADLIGLDRGILTEAVDKWNTTCANGVDPEGNFPPEWLLPIKKAPFYGAKVGSYLVMTACGLHVNTKMQVMGTNGKPIEGLYAGGACSGGVAGENTYGSGCSPLGNNALTWAMGYLAVKNAIAS
jgi:fumarate reductase flavoprotein subunit